MSKPSRNDPCPCGSGKKYKKCCLRKEEESRIPQKTYHDHCLELVRSLEKRIMKFAGKMISERETLEAIESYWQTLDVNLEPPEMDDEGYLGFIDWLIHDYRLEKHGKPIVRLFLESRPKLPAEEMAILQGWQDTNISVFQAKEIRPGEGVLLEDIFSHDETFISDVALSRNIRQWGLVATRTFKVLDEWQAASVGNADYPRFKEDIYDFVTGCFADYQSSFPEATIKDFLKSQGHLINHYYLTRSSGPNNLPQILTSSGEDVVFREAVYDIKDIDRIVDMLEMADDFESTEWELDEKDRMVSASFDWLQRGQSIGVAKKGKSTGDVELRSFFTEGPGEPAFLVLGNLKLKPNRVILSVMGDKRFELGKARLQEILGNQIKHRIDTVKSMEAVMAERREPIPQGEDIPQEVKTQIMKDILDRHYREWMDISIPALKGKTPREAAGLEDHHHLLEDLLRQLEHSNSGISEDVEYDITWVRKELGF